MSVTLLIGNGLNRSISNAISWEHVLSETAQELGLEMTELNSLLGKQQPTFYFEHLMNQANEKIRLSSARRNIPKKESGNGTKIREDDDYLELKRLCCNILKNVVPNVGKIHGQFSSLPGVRDIMTTNYDYRLEESLNENFSYNSKDFAQKNEDGARVSKNDKYSTSQKFSYTVGGKQVWHIHGEIEYPRTVCLGFGHYIGTIKKLKDILDINVLTEYLACNCDVLKTKERLIASNPEEKKNSSSFDSIGKDVETLHSCWATKFFTDDIYIVGLGLDYCELDIWWVLQWRAYLKNFNDDFKSLITNEIVYYHIENPHAIGIAERALKKTTSKLKREQPESRLLTSEGSLLTTDAMTTAEVEFIEARDALVSAKAVPLENSAKAALLKSFDVKGIPHDLIDKNETYGAAYLKIKDYISNDILEKSRSSHRRTL